jgi:hypothetical protein
VIDHAALHPDVSVVAEHGRDLLRIITRQAIRPATFTSVTSVKDLELTPYSYGVSPAPVHPRRGVSPGVARRLPTPGAPVIRCGGRRSPIVELLAIWHPADGQNVQDRRQTSTQHRTVQDGGDHWWEPHRKRRPFGTQPNRDHQPGAVVAITGGNRTECRDQSVRNPTVITVCSTRRRIGRNFTCHRNSRI